MLIHRNRKWLLILSFVIVVVTLAVTSYFIPGPYDIYAKNEYTGQKECAAYHIATFVISYVGAVLEAHNGAVTAIATCFIAWFTLTLKNSTLKLWKIGSRQFELEGPFLYPMIQFGRRIEDQLIYFFMHDHPTSPVSPVAVEISFKIKNVGRSPALLRSVAAEIGHLTAMIQEPRVGFSADPVLEPIIEAGQETRQPITRALQIPIEKADFYSLRDGESRLFLYGEIAFSDLVGTDYVQTFCFAYDFRSKSFIQWAGKYNRRRIAQPHKE